MDGFTIGIVPGTASAEEITELLVALSDLFQACGGPGFEYHLLDAFVLPDGQLLQFIAVFPHVNSEDLDK